MSDEIKKAQEEAQRMAKELGLYEILRNIATNGSNHSEPSESKWGRCLIKYKVKETGLDIWLIMTIVSAVLVLLAL